MRAGLFSKEGQTECLTLYLPESATAHGTPYRNRGLPEGTWLRPKRICLAADEKVKSGVMNITHGMTKTENDVPRLANQICFPLYACAKEVVRQYREPLEELNLTYTQYLVMMVLWEHGGMTEGELGRKIRLNSGTLAPLLKRLDKAGYIHRIRPDNNERKLFLSLTEEGEILREKAKRVPQKMRGCIPLSEDELLLLREMLNRALAGMDDRIEGGT